MSPAPSPRSERRTDALSRERIVDAAIEILDADGEAALTFRALAARLNTGAGAIYHHVANKGELLIAAADVIVARATASPADESDPREAIRTGMLGLYDAIDSHPWVGTQLSSEPWQLPMLRILEAIGTQLPMLQVPQPAQFHAATALMNCVLGLAAQHAAAARILAREADPSAAFDAIVARWAELDVIEYPFVKQIAPQLADHDDREQFLAGIDLILAGIAAIR